MPAESSHRRARSQKYTFVMLPTSEESTPKRVTLGKLGIAGVGAAVLGVSVMLVLGVLILTPLGVYIPIPNPELENRYHRQVVAIQNRLTQLTEDLVFLRDYNLRLRKALGERISPDDSAFISAQVIAQQRPSGGDGQERLTEDGGSSLAGSPPVEPGDQARSGLARPAAFIVRAVENDLPMAMPVRGYVTQQFDQDQRHFGIDFAAREGTGIHAVADGSVVFAGWTYEDGYMIMLAHSGGYRTTYKHNKALLKAQGDVVRRGETIALLGNSGRTSYGPHLHFEVWKDGVPRNPKDFLLSLQ